MSSTAPWRRVLAGTAALACLTLLAPLAAASPSLDAAATALAPGAQGPAVTLLQETINDWGVSVGVDGTFDAATVAALAKAATMTGGAGDNIQTQLALIGFGPRAPQLQYGDSGPDVAALQRALTRAGDGVEATGVFGPQTRDEVLAFQQAHGLPADGIITLWQIEQVFAPAAPAAPAAAAAPTAPAAPSAVGTRVADLAASLRGRAYAWGGLGPWSFDCSGLVSYVFQTAVGLSLPHSSYLQWMVGRPVAAGTLQPGDLVFFDTDGWGPSHVGIYLGGVDQDFIDATNPAGGVQVNTLYSAYWAAHYVGARDVLG